jgi:hypothetical protein
VLRQYTEAERVKQGAVQGKRLLAPGSVQTKEEKFSLFSQQKKSIFV